MSIPSSALLSLIDDACLAEEMFGVDECERYAEEVRKNLRGKTGLANGTHHHLRHDSARTRELHL